MKPIALFAVAAVLAGCATNPSTEVPTVSSLALTLNPNTVGAGATTAVTATATLSDGTTPDVTTQAVWSVSGTPVIALLACTQSPCPVTALTAGTATITAAFGGKTATATLTITAPTLSSVTVSASSASVPVGESVACSATGVFSDGTEMDLTATATWTSSTPAIAAVSAAGVVTAATVGMTTITATAMGLTGTASVTVVAAVPVSLAISPVPATVAVGQTLQLSVIATFSDGSSMDDTLTATWTTGDMSVASVTTVGLLIPAMAGMATITAMAGGLSASESVTVLPPQVTSIAITPSPATVAAGLTQQLVATATFTDMSTMDVSATATWATGDPTVATISSTGLVTGVKAGVVTVTATVGTVVANDIVTVGSAVVQSLAINAPSTSLPKGSTEQLTATATFSDGSMMDVTSSATWTNATAGLVTASAVGSLTVTATEGSASAMVTITVTAPVAKALSVTAPQTTVPAVLAVQLTATLEFTDGTTQDATASATWTSSDTAGTTGTVSTVGLLSTISPGTVTITAVSGAFSAQSTITIVSTIAAITVTPGTVTIPAGQTQQLTVTARLSDSTMLGVTPLATWSTDDPAHDIATVSASGLVTAVETSATVVNVTAALGGTTGSAQVTVSE